MRNALMVSRGQGKVKVFHPGIDISSIPPQGKMMIDRQANLLFQSLLEANETLLWSGRPACGWLSLSGWELLALPFLLFMGWQLFQWEYFALAMALHARETHTPLIVAWFFPLFGLIFVVILLGIILNFLVWTPLRRRNTLYALTNQRLLINATRDPKKTQRIPLNTIRMVMIEPSPLDVIEAFRTFRYNTKTPDHVAEATMLSSIDRISGRKPQGNLRLQTREMGEEEEWIRLVGITRPAHLLQLIRERMTPHQPEPGPNS
jgi:hypothetical protein